MATTSRNPDGTYTTTLTAREQAVVTRLATTKGVPAARVIEELVERFLRTIYLQSRQRDADARQDAYDAAAPAVKTQVDTALNFTPEV